MPIHTVTDLVEALRATPLLTAAQLEELARDLQPRCTEPRALARALLERDWLTPYQVNQVFLERGQDLVLGPYLLLERLGEGGMGQVFKARHLRMDRVVALKVIRKEKLANPRAVRRFYREVQAAAHLAHPNIVLALDADEVDNRLFFAMEYVEGLNLARLVKQAGPLPVEQACAYARQVALALQHIHERGLVHRDIKPSNLLLTGQGSVIKILDLGLARLNRADEGSALTQAGWVLGTVDYLAPEQGMNASAVDTRADLYGLGCTLFFLLTGRVPFPGGTAMERILKHRNEEPTPVEKLRPDVPRKVALVVRRLMARRPEDRYQTPAEAAAALADAVRLETM